MTDERRLDRLADAIDFYLDPERAESADGELLSRHGELREFLEPMLADDDASMPPPATEPVSRIEPGRVIGDFRIVQEVGRGGMGVVFEAEQISLGRRVALKALLPHLTLGARQIERFRREAAHAASLRHPSIVPIFEVGEAHGVHFFAMEFIDGRRLDALVSDALHDPRSTDTRIGQITELCAQVAEALDYAHEQGVVHRDVKPQNIIVDDSGRARLLDFGLAKLRDDDSQSQSGIFVGTPHYVSPEQARAEYRDVGPTSDVFSLGVVLYELLTGTRPFAGGSADDVLRAVRTVEPRAVRTLVRMVPRDLETICAKALEKEPQRRYASAAEFAADLRSFQQGHPIQARAIGWSGRALRYARRHPAGVTATSLALLLVLGGPIAYAVSEHYSHEAVRQERDEVRKADAIAFRTMERLVSALHELVGRESKLESDSRKQIDQAVALCDDYLARSERDPARMSNVAQSLWRISAIQSMVGDYESARQTLRRASDLVGEHPAKQELPVAILRAHIACQRASLANFLPTEHLDEVDSYFDSVMLWRDIVARTTDEENVNARVNLVRALTNLSKLLASALGDEERAQTAAVEAIEIADALPDAATRAPTFAFTLFRARTEYGRTLLRQGRKDDAQSQFEKIIAASEAIESPRASIRAHLADAQCQLATILQSHGRFTDAEELFRAAVETGESITAELPGKIFHLRVLIAARVKLSALLLNKKEFDDALAIATAARDEAERLVAASDSPRERNMLASSLSRMANVYLVQRQPEKAKPLIIASLAARGDDVEKSSDPTQLSNRGATLSNLAALENEFGSSEQARDHALAAIELQQRAIELMPTHPQFMRFLGSHFAQLAYASSRLGKYREAERAAHRSVELRPQNINTTRMCADALSHCVGLLADETSTPEHNRMSERLGAQAVAWLARFKDRVPARLKLILETGAFAAIDEREDFRELRESLR